MHNKDLGNIIIQISTVDSTNTYAQQLLQQKSGIVDGTVINAINQEGGRGQRGRTWESEKGKNLTFSIIVLPDFLKGEDQFLISKTVALGILDYLKRTIDNCSDNLKRSVAIKWPNDVYVNDRKICGILIENSITGRTITQSIIGVGVNVNQTLFKNNLVNPTSIALETDLQYDLDKVLKDVLNSIDARYKMLTSNHLLTIDEDYLKEIYQLGEWCTYHINGVSTQAKIVGVSPIGKLVLENQAGNTLVCDNNEIEYQLGG
jgi:BirA family biotin operon repressor/biotin-[acetyl-CoA-carboxylase] ligase